jgi:GT2 family glycosyltransferase
VPLPENPTDSQVNVAGLAKGEFVTANCCVVKSRLEDINGFDERFYKAWREDSDLYFTLLERRVKMRFIPEAVVSHPARTSGFGVSVGMQKNNVFEALLYKKHPELYKKYVNFPVLKKFYAIDLLMVVMFISVLAHWKYVGITAFALWAFLTFLFVLERLRHSSKDSKHILEMIITSILIPPLAVYWRLVGVFKFKLL